jgi:hypothetical protein
LSYIYVSLSVTLSEGVDGGYYAEHFFLWSISCSLIDTLSFRVLMIR